MSQSQSSADTRADKLSPKFDIRPQAVERWLRELPRGSVGQTGQLVFNALQDIQRQDIKANDRFRVLEALRDSVHYATSNLNKHVYGVAYPLPEKVMRIASACQSIHDSMAQSYLSVFHDLQKQNSLFVDKRMLTTAIHRAIVYIEHSLLLTYEVYSAFQHDHWEQLHELYQYAELHKLTQLTVYESLGHPKKKSNISQEYLRTLLLYLAEPYHLRPGEINEVHHHLEHWSELCTLLKVTSDSELIENQLAIIDLNNDQPPKNNLNNNHTISAEHCRLLETKKLIKTLKKERKQLIKDKPSLNKLIVSDTPSISLLRRLIESWEHTRQRRFPRQTLNAPVNVTIGLHHAHMQLMYEQHLKKTEQNKNAYSGFHQKHGFEHIEIKAVENEHSDVWSTVYSWANSANPKPNPQLTATRDSNKNQPESIVDYRVKQGNWTLINESAEGLALVCPENLSSKVQVGEIISVQRKNSTERSIGLVRWMKARGKTGIELGIMLLAPSAKPVGLIVEDPEKGDYVIDRGLLLPLMSALNRPESLMSFSRQYKAGDVLRINQPGKDNVKIKLVKLIADNGTVSQFLFTWINTGVKNALPDHDATSTSEHDDHDQFSDIWQSI